MNWRLIILMIGGLMILAAAAAVHEYLFISQPALSRNVSVNELREKLSAAIFLEKMAVDPAEVVNDPKFRNRESHQAIPTLEESGRSNPFLP